MLFKNKNLDSGFRRNDGEEEFLTFYETVNGDLML
jgi:hypothetical protein